MRYSYDITYVPGKNLHTADALSRSPIENDNPGEDFGEAVETYVESLMHGLQCNVATSAMMTRIKQAYKEDPVCAQVMAYCEHGWPPIMRENPAMREFYQVHDELSVEQGLLLPGSRIVIPSLLRAEILEMIHMGYLGIHKCRETARRNAWWPCMSSQIADMIRACRKCHRNRPEHSERLMPLEFPERPWECIGTDLFHWHNSEYLVAVDYHSRFFEVAAAYIAMLISIIYRSLYCCMLTGIHRSMERVTSDFRRSCLASSSSVFIVAINTCNTLQWRRVRDTNSCERLITCSSGIRDK